MTRPQTHVEYEILQQDAARNIFYSSFDDFWDRRLEPMQFIDASAKGALAVLREKLKEQAAEQFRLFCQNYFHKELLHE